MLCLPQCGNLYQPHFKTVWSCIHESSIFLFFAERSRIIWFLMSERMKKALPFVAYELFTQNSKKVYANVFPQSTRTCTRTSSSLHEHVSSQMNRILMAEDDLPVWVTQGRTVLYQVGKSNTADNYRTITCFPLMWKLLTGVIAEEIYNYLEQEKIISE